MGWNPIRWLAGGTVTRTTPRPSRRCDCGAPLPPGVRGGLCAECLDEADRDDEQD